MSCMGIMWTNWCCRKGGYEGREQSGTTVVFCMGVSPYTVHVGISVAKAG
jgi:hypothetical protein